MEPVLRRLALALGVLAVLLLVAAGPGVRLELWSYRTGFQMLRWAVYLGGAAAVLSLGALFFRRTRSFAALVALLLGLTAAAIPLEFQRRARQAPPINDVSTGSQIQPLVLTGAPSVVFARAEAAARDMGWEIVTADAAAGRIEAVATTFWFGFKDDLTILVTPQGAQARVDVRSRSRVGRGDAGTNARRIQAYLKRLQ